jgi:ornithine decarboxylase
VAGAYAGAIGETIGFYAVILVRDLRGRRGDRAGLRTARGLLVEFGPAELVDTFAARPLAMYGGAALVGNTLGGVLIGKVAADVVFYALAIIGYEMRRSVTAAAGAEAGLEAGPSLTAERATASVPPSPSASGNDPIAAVALDDVPHATPYLMMDLGSVGRAFLRLDDALGLDAIHYAVKCNPDPRVLATLHRLGCRFEVASYPELALLVEIGVEPGDVLYSNPVKPVDHIRRAYQAGCWRFAADSDEELTKLARHAPGVAVYVRLRTRATTASAVLSEGKFGVEPRQARELLRAAAAVGLVPHGLAFHVGSQMTEAHVWAVSIAEAGAVMDELAAAGVVLQMLDIGGGFPAHYGQPVPALRVYGDVIQQALRRLPYRLRVVAEPGRALVGEAGVLVATVIGTAVRSGQRWVHLDVGAFNGMMEALETGNTLMYPLSDSRRATTLVHCHLTGPTCDSQDTIMFDVALSAGLTEGDRVYIGTAGAYTTAYASTFNGFDVPATHCLSGN